MKRIFYSLIVLMLLILTGCNNVVWNGNEHPLIVTEINFSTDINKGMYEYKVSDGCLTTSVYIYSDNKYSIGDTLVIVNKNEVK